MNPVATIAVTSPAVAAIVAVIAGASGAIAAYLVSRRQFSGKVQTTEAGSLWVAMDGFQRNLSAEIARVNMELQISREREDICEARLAALYTQLDSAAEALKEVGDRIVATVHETVAVTHPESSPLLKETP